MAHITQVLLYITFFLSVYGHDEEEIIRRRLYKGPTIYNIVNPHGLLEAAARLAYPITSGINNAVGSWTSPSNYYPRRNNYPHNEFERHSAHPYNERYTENVYNLLGALRKLIRMNSQHPNWEYPYESSSEEIDKSYYDPQFFEAYDSSEAVDDLLSHYAKSQTNSGPNSLDPNERAVHTEDLKDTPKYDSIQQSMPAADFSNINVAGIDVRASPDVTSIEDDDDDVKIYFGDTMTIPSEEDPVSTNLNQNNIVEPYSNSIGLNTNK